MHFIKFTILYYNVIFFNAQSKVKGNKHIRVNSFLIANTINLCVKVLEKFEVQVEHVRSTLNSPIVSFFLSLIILNSNTSSYIRVHEPTYSDLTSLLSIENEHVCPFMPGLC